MKTSSILTTTANAVTSPVHDRMPAILDPDCYDLWLDPAMTNMAAASDLLKPLCRGDSNRNQCPSLCDTGVVLGVITTGGPEPKHIRVTLVCQ
jgi:putative SOS response-associated peptidase YedK